MRNQIDLAYIVTQRISRQAAAALRAHNKAYDRYLGKRRIYAGSKSRWNTVALAYASKTVDDTWESYAAVRRRELGLS